MHARRKPETAVSTLQELNLVGNVFQITCNGYRQLILMMKHFFKMIIDNHFMFFLSVRSIIQQGEGQTHKTSGISETNRHKALDIIKKQ